MICMKNLRFSSHPRAKVRRQGPLGSARAQPCSVPLKPRWSCVTTCAWSRRFYGKKGHCEQSRTTTLDGERRCLDANSRFCSTIKLHVHNPSPQATMNGTVRVSDILPSVAKKENNGDNLKLFFLNPGNLPRPFGAKQMASGEDTSFLNTTRARWEHGRKAGKELCVLLYSNLYS